MFADLANTKRVLDDGEYSDPGAPGGPILLTLDHERPLSVDESMLILGMGRCWFLYARNSAWTISITVPLSVTVMDGFMVETGRRPFGV